MNYKFKPGNLLWLLPISVILLFILSILIGSGKMAGVAGILIIPNIIMCITLCEFRNWDTLEIEFGDDNE